MKNMNELMDMINSFQVALDDIEFATKDNNEIAEQNIKGALIRYGEILKPYSEAYCKLINEPIRAIDIARKAYPLGVESIRLVSNGNIYVQTSGFMGFVNFEFGYFEKSYSNTEKQCILTTLSSFLDGDNIKEFDLQFESKIKKIMEDKIKEADKKYKASIDFKYLVTQ